MLLYIHDVFFRDLRKLGHIIIVLKPSFNPIDTGISYSRGRIFHIFEDIAYKLDIKTLTDTYCYIKCVFVFWGADFTWIWYFSPKNVQSRKITEKTNDKNATQHIIQAISMAVQRGNATSIMGTLGPQRKLDEYFDIIVPKKSNH